MIIQSQLVLCTLLLAASVIVSSMHIINFIIEYETSSNSQRIRYVLKGIVWNIIIFMTIYLLHNISTVPNTEFLETLICFFMVFFIFSIRIHEKTAFILHGGISDMFLVLAVISSIVLLMQIIQ